MNGVFGFLIFLGISVFCWLMVLKPSFRQKQNKPAHDFWRLNYYFWRLKKQDRRDLDAVSMAASLVGAMFFSMITLVFIVIAVVRFLSR